MQIHHTTNFIETKKDVYTRVYTFIIQNNSRG